MIQKIPVFDFSSCSFSSKENSSYDMFISKIQLQVSSRVKGVAGDKQVILVCINCMPVQSLYLKKEQIA